MLLAVRACCCRLCCAWCSVVLLATRCVVQRGAAGCAARGAVWCCWLHVRSAVPPSLLLSLRCAVVRATCCWQRGAAGRGLPVGARCGARGAVGACGRISTPDRPLDFSGQMPDQCIGNVGNMLENHRAKGFLKSGSGRPPKARFLDLGRLYPGGGKQWVAPVPAL